MIETMKTKFIFLILAVSLLSIASVMAQNETGIDIEISADEISNAGITPDSIFYGLDIGLERVTEMFSENAKLKHAKERLSEVKVMLQENKVEMAEKGRQNFNKLRLRIKNQTRIQEHSELMDNLGQKISAIASQKGQLNKTQKQEINQLILQHQERIREESEEIGKRLSNELVNQAGQNE